MAEEFFFKIYLHGIVERLLVLRAGKMGGKKMAGKTGK